MVDANEKEPRSIRLQGQSECQLKERDKQGTTHQQKLWEIQRDSNIQSVARFTVVEPVKVYTGFICPVLSEQSDELHAPNYTEDVHVTDQL